MKPQQYKTFIKKVFLEMPHRAVLVSGAVGVGKSETTRQAVEEVGFEYRDIRLSLLDATDLRGLPDIDKNQNVTKWTRPVFLPPEDDNKDRVLFFDEFSNANQSVQNACLQLMLDRQIGEYKLPSKTRVICAGNRLQDGAFVFRLSSALNNRFIHVDYDTDFEDWKTWAYKNNINPLVISFHNFRRGELLNNYSDDIETKAFATPRSWYFVHEILKIGLENGTLFEAIKGAIGEGAGTEFYGYMKIYRDIPDVDRILKGEDIVPSGANILYALCGALIYAVRQDKTKVERLIKYSLKLPEEFSVLLIKDAVKTELQTEILTSPAMTEWSKKYKELIA